MGVNGGTAFKIDTDGSTFKKFFNPGVSNVDRGPTGF
jgi:hypothetical protein